jgi:Carboxypeptidase regulatory-like domain
MAGCKIPSLLLLLCTTGFLVAQPAGKIRGTVVDQTGNTVAGATLYAQPEGLMAMVVPQCTTDENGSCTISQLALGPYFVYAGKPDAGYPDLGYPFFQPRGTKPKEAILWEDHPSDDVVVLLGVKAGILKGTVADAVSGKPLNAMVEFRWVSDPDNFLSGSGLTNAQFRIQVPSDTGLKMVVTLDGYQDWVYGVDGGMRGKALFLHPEQQEILDIRLKPKPASVH